VFVYDKSGGHVFNNGSKQANPGVPPEAISVAVHPAKPAGYGRVYAMFAQFVLNPSRILLSYADAPPDGTHTDWSPPQVLPTIPGHPWDTYLLPHVAPDGTLDTTVTNKPVSKGFLHNSIYLISSKDGGVTWQGPTLVIPSVLTPAYLNTTFSEGIVNSFGLGSKQVNGHWPLYVAYENQDTDGLSRVYVAGSLDGGATWSAPIRVNDGPDDVEALQPRVEVAPSGTVAVAFYDRRPACPSDPASGVQFDPLAPAGKRNYCINTAIQFYRPDLTTIGHNLRLSQFTWDPQLNAPQAVLHLWVDHVYRRLPRARFRWRLRLHGLGLNLRLRPEPQLLPAADRREGAPAIAVLSPEVGDAAGGWQAAECGVGPLVPSSRRR
jgi:hypothetical protein